MSNRFVCRFAVGKNDLAYSGIWRVWTARNQPDLYLAVEIISRELKATVHCPRPPHIGWKRHYSFPKEASGKVAAAAKKDGGPHKVQWTGYEIGHSCCAHQSFPWGTERSFGGLPSYGGHLASRHSCRRRLLRSLITGTARRGVPNSSRPIPCFFHSLRASRNLLDKACSTTFMSKSPTRSQTRRRAGNASFSPSLLLTMRPLSLARLIADSGRSLTIFW